MTNERNHSVFEGALGTLLAYAIYTLIRNARDIIAAVKAGGVIECRFCRSKLQVPLDVIQSWKPGEVKRVNCMACRTVQPVLRTVDD